MWKPVKILKKVVLTLGFLEGSIRFKIIILPYLKANIHEKVKALFVASSTRFYKEVKYSKYIIGTTHPSFSLQKTKIFLTINKRINFRFENSRHILCFSSVIRDILKA